jgi:hypothetical protein
MDLSEKIAAKHRKHARGNKHKNKCSPIPCASGFSHRCSSSLLCLRCDKEGILFLDNFGNASSFHGPHFNGFLFHEMIVDTVRIC